MPNRRRRKLSTAMSAFAALAVASPFAVTAITEMTASGKPAPEQHEFVQAALITDLPGEIMSALQSSLSQFGVVVPNLPSGLTGPANTGLGATPGLGTTGLTPTPGLGTPGLGTTGLTAPGLPALTTAPLTDAAIANPALSNPALTPAAGALPAGLTTPPAGLTIPPIGANPVPTGLNPALTSPTGLPPALGTVPGEVPIGAQLGADPLAGTYPILGDPSLGMPAAAAPSSGGLLGSLDSMASQLGASQAIDLLKGVVVPSIMQAIKGAVPAAPGAPAAAVSAIPGVPALPAAALALPAAGMPAPPAIPTGLTPGVTIPAH